MRRRDALIVHAIHYIRHIVGIRAVEYLHRLRKPWGYRQTKMVSKVNNLSRHSSSGYYSICSRGFISDDLRGPGPGMDCLWLVEIHQVLRVVWLDCSYESAIH